jgi:hypothetical protein
MARMGRDQATEMGRLPGWEETKLLKWEGPRITNLYVLLYSDIFSQLRQSPVLYQHYVKRYAMAAVPCFHKYKYFSDHTCNDKGMCTKQTVGKHSVASNGTDHHKAGR